jgi:hypothetical protein
MSDAGPSKSFWVTVPGFITAVGGLIGALGVLIGSLSAAGVLGSGSGPSTTSSPPAGQASPGAGGIADAVIHGRWTTVLTVRSAEGVAYMGTNNLWGFVDPQRGDQATETWILDSVCPDQACAVRWDSVETPDRFALLRRDPSGGGYIGTDTGHAGCDPIPADVDRRLELHVADAQEVNGVWHARALEGEITISWTCAGHEVGGILDVSATAAPE